MALRITQNLMYSSYVTHMNNNLSSLMETNYQTATQKRINRPSDDSVGSSRVLSFRATLDTISRYKQNINTASGWIQTANTTLSSDKGSLTGILDRLVEITEQGATETYTKENREQISYELRQIFNTVLNLSNTKFNGSHIFAGHKIDQPAYKEVLGATCRHSDFDGVDFTTEGGAQKSVLIQATSNGPAATATYRYSADGGTTWQAATVDATLPSPPYAAGHMRINAGGASVIFDPAGVNVQQVDPANIHETNNGTWIYVRPTAQYMGDDTRTEVVMPANASVNASVEGYFTGDIAVRVDKIDGGMINYSYSTDDGNNWIPAVAPDSGPGSRVPVPGGYLTLTGSPVAGDQFGIHPRRAAMGLSISDFDTIELNQVGMNIFGGVYQDPDPTVSPGYATVVPGKGNLFESLGNLIAYAETNSPDGFGRALEDFKQVLQRVTTAAAEAGGKVKRLDSTMQVLTLREYAETDGLSAIEDADLTELTTKLAAQQLAYNSVLKSSSMIMQLSLVNFL